MPTVGEIFKLAQERSESLALLNQSVLQADQKVIQARGAFLPVIAAVGTYTRQQSPSSSSSSAFTRADQSTAKLTLAQPLFQGAAEYAAWRTALDQKSVSQLDWEAGKVTVYREVVSSFYEGVAADKDLGNLRELLELTAKRVQELESRVRIGRSRRGELLSAQAQAAQVAAQIETAQVRLALARRRLMRLTHLQEIPNLIWDEKTSDSIQLPAPETLLNEVSARPDLKALQVRSEISDEAIQIARAGHLPTLELTGNYYLKRTGVLSDTDWDVGLQISLPLFNGGIVSAQVREAALGLQKQNLEFESARLNAEVEIRDTHEKLRGAISRLKLLDQAASLAKENYQEQVRDFRSGLVTHLEVLQALNQYIEDRRELDQTRVECESNHRLLWATVGRITL